MALRSRLSAVRPPLSTLRPHLLSTIPPIIGPIETFPRRSRIMEEQHTVRHYLIAYLASYPILLRMLVFTLQIAKVWLALPSHSNNVGTVVQVVHHLGGTWLSSPLHDSLSTPTNSSVPCRPLSIVYQYREATYSIPSSLPQQQLLWHQSLSMLLHRHMQADQTRHLHH